MPRNNQHHLYGKGLSDSDLQSPAAPTSKKKSRTSKSSSSSSSSSSSPVVLPIIFPLIFLACATLDIADAQEFVSHVNIQKDRLEALTGDQPTGTVRRKRKARDKKTTVAHEYLDAINDLLNDVGTSELETIGCTQYATNDMTDDDLEPLQRPSNHSHMCVADGCSNIERATHPCYTCQNSYCHDHVQDNVAEGITYIGTNHESVWKNGDGGTVFCQECADALPHPVLNIPAISGRIFECDTWTDGTHEQRKILNSRTMEGTNREVLTEEDIQVPYYTKQTDRPINEDTDTSYTVNQIPETKPVKQKRVYKGKRMTQNEDLLKKCPGCGNEGCNVKCEVGRKEYPAGMEQLEKMRDRLTFLLDHGDIDQAYNYVMQHISFKPVDKSHYSRIFKKMECSDEQVAARVAAGVECTFCQRANAVNCAGIPLNNPMKVHKRRTKNMCGPHMHNAGVQYLARHGASTDATCTLPGPPGGANKEVPMSFFQRLFCCATGRTLRRKIAEKRKGKLGSTVEASLAKGGRNSGLTPLQHTNLEAILEHEDFEQQQSHYAPSSEENDYRYAVGVAKASFWWKYCETHDPDFYAQCERLNHKHGLDDPTKRPNDLKYYTDAQEQNNAGNMTAFNLSKIKKIYDTRTAMRAEIVTLTATKVAQEALATQNSGNAAAAQHQTNALAATVQILVLEKKLNSMTKCNIAADVSYTSAVRFYKKYKIKTGKIKQDTCKTCESLCLLIKHSAGATRARHEATWRAHVKMADEGFKWRKEDRARAQAQGSKTHMMVIDFGQALRTPALSIGSSWYRRIQKGSYSFCLVLC